MTPSRHGISIGLERIEDEYFLTLKATGKLTHSDYKKITPILEPALEGFEEESIRVLFDATDLEGWEFRAAWDDLRLGLKFGNKFKKIAVYGNKNWQEYATRISSWFTSGDVQFFETFYDALQFLKKN